MLTFYQFVGLDEDLSDATLSLYHQGSETSTRHGWRLEHPQFGRLAHVDLYSTDGQPIKHAKSASVDIDIYHNPNVPEADKATVPWSNNGTTSPAYKLGVHTTKKLLHHLRLHYPNLERIHDSPRVTGVRQKIGKTSKSAEIHLRHPVSST